MSSDYVPFVGPFGFWMFPLVNAIRQRLQGRSSQRLFAKPGPRETLRNAEKWGIVRDEKGRMIALEIHRTVEEP